jgi:cell division septum initiation protein DivIVA
MGTSIEAAIGEVQKEINELQQRIDQLNFAIEKHPDATVTTDRWNRKSVSANLSTSDNVQLEFRHSCGCCPDAGIYASFYIDYGDKGIIYHERIYIGCGAYGGGEEPSETWREDITKAGFSAFIPQIEKYFEDNDPSRYDD